MRVFETKARLNSDFHPKRMQLLKGTWKIVGQPKSVHKEKRKYFGKK